MIKEIKVKLATEWQYENCTKVEHYKSVTTYAFVHIDCWDYLIVWHDLKQMLLKRV